MSLSKLTNRFIISTNSKLITNKATIKFNHLIINKRSIHLSVLFKRDNTSTNINRFDDFFKNTKQTTPQHQNGKVMPLLVSIIAITFYYLLNDSNDKSNYLTQMFKYLLNNLCYPLEAKDVKSEVSEHLTPRQLTFLQFASVDYKGVPYMTPQDFVESMTEDYPRPRIHRKELTKEVYDKIIYNTPTRRNGNKRLFRTMEDQGIISYSEYLFLLCVITSKFSLISFCSTQFNI
jgi:hypothetical protein